MMIKTPPMRSNSAFVWVLQKRGPVVPVLSLKERRRAAKFKIDHSRELYIFARTQLRYILGAYLKQHPSDVRIVEGSHGKPLVIERGGGSINFNISHSGAVIGIIISLTTAVGIDIEMAPVASKCDILSMIETFLSEREIDHLNSFEIEKKRRMALRYWTIKESCLKALGVGLSLDPRSIELPLGGEDEVGPVFCPQNPVLTAKLCFHSLPLPSQILGVVTTESNIIPNLIQADSFNSET